MDLGALMTDLEPWLSVIGSLCVIVGTVFVVIRAEDEREQAASATAFGVISSVTHPSFAARRHLLYEVSAKYASGDWTGFDHSREDVEVRNYASIYWPNFKWLAGQNLAWIHRKAMTAEVTAPRATGSHAA